MAWPTYSERFFHHQGAGTWRSVVPAGKRAIVTHLDGVSTVAGSHWISLAAGPIYATLVLIPAPNVGFHEVMRLVAYEGEELALTIEVTGIHVNVCGYLLDDPAGAGGPAMESTWEPHRDLQPLPALGEPAP